VALAACPEQGPTPPVGSGGTALSYGCTDPPATTGGDHGPEWDWGDSDTGSLKLDSASLPPEEDPTMWSVHSASGAYYRSPTEGEMLAYGWDSYTLLVIPPSAFVSGVTGPGGASPPTLVLPLHDFTQSRPQEDLDVVAVQLTLEWAHDRTPFHEIVVGRVPFHRVRRPVMRFFLGYDMNGQEVEGIYGVVGSSHGAIEVLGGNRLDRVTMRGPYDASNGPFALEIGQLPPAGAPVETFYVQQTIRDAWTLEGMTLHDAPDGLVATAALIEGDQLPVDEFADGPAARPAATLSGQCNDGLDNDPDGFADDCDYNCVPHEDFGGLEHDHVAVNEYSKDYVLLGDAKLCACVTPMGPESLLMMHAMGAAKIFNNIEPPPESAYEPDIRMPPLRLVMFGCAANFNELYGEPELACEAAVDCHDDDDCPPSLDYLLAGTSNNFSQIRAKVWDVVEQHVAGATESSDVHPVHMAGIVTNRISTASGTGLAWFWDPSTPHMNGSFVLTAGPANMKPAGTTLAHEILHTFGLAHDTVFVSGLSAWGIMHEFSGGVPAIDWDAPSAVGSLTQGEAWLGIASKFLPRSSGFKLTECDPQNQNACQTGHPGLSCQQAGGLYTCRP
jgi:hypothetical protein